jgi:hypothetical protein
MSFVLNINAGPEDDLRALMGRPPGAGPLDLGEPFKVLSSGVYFAPDPHSWALLAPSEQRALAPPPGMGESVIADEVRPYWRRVLPFPFSAPQLLRFAEYAMLPALCEWMERDQEDPAFDDMLADAPRALALARFLAGGASPDVQQDCEAPAPDADNDGAEKRPPQTMEWNRLRVLRALQDAGFDRLALPPCPKGKAWEAKQAAKVKSGLTTASFAHAWGELSESKRIQQRP